MGMNDKNQQLKPPPPLVKQTKDHTVIERETLLRIAQGGDANAKAIYDHTKDMSNAQYNQYKKERAKIQPVTGSLEQIAKSGKYTGFGNSKLYEQRASEHAAYYKSVENNRAVEASSFIDSAKGYAFNYSMSSDIRNAFEKYMQLNHSDGAEYEDKAFMSGVNSDFALSYMENNNIPYKAQYADLIMGAKNQKHLNSITSFINNEIYMRNTIDSSLGSKMQGISAFHGAVQTDPLTVLAAPQTILPKAWLAWKGTRSAMATAGISAGVSGSMEYIRNYGDPSLTLDENMFNIGVGMFADIASTAMAVKRLDLNSNHLMDTIQTTANDMDNAAKGSKHFDITKQDITPNYRWSTDAPNSDIIRKSDTIMNVATTARVAETIVDTVAPISRAFGVDTIDQIATTKDLSKYISQNQEAVTKAFDEAVAKAKTLAPTEREKALKEIRAAADSIKATSPELSSELKLKAAKSQGITTDPQMLKKEADKKAGVKAFKTKQEALDNIRTASVAKAKEEFATLGKSASRQLNLSDTEMQLLKQVQSDIKTTKSLLNETGLKSVEKELKTLEARQTALIDKGLGGETSQLNKEVYSRLASIVDEIASDIDSTLGGNILDLIPDEAGKKAFLQSLSDDLTEFFGSAIKVTLDGEKLKFTGEAKLPIKNGYALIGNNKLLVGTALAVAGSTSAMADDGGGVSVTDIGLLLLGGFLAVRGAKTFAKSVETNGGVMNTLKAQFKSLDSASRQAEFAAQPDNIARTDFFNKIANLAETGYMSSYVTVKKFGSESAVKLLNELVENPQGFSGVPADIEKMQTMNTVLNRFNRSERTAYSAWVKETGQTESLYSKALDIGAETPLMSKFREDVSRYIENPNLSESAVLRKHANEMSKEMDALFDEAQRLGLKGFEVDKKIENYLTRFVKHENITEICSTVEGENALIDAITSAIVGKIGTARIGEAREAAASWVRYEANVSKSTVKETDVDRLINGLHALNVDISSLDRADLLKASSLSSDMVSRIKDRIPMDLEKFTPFKATVHGVQTEIGMADVFERNSNDIFKRYTSQMAGHIALGKTVSNFESEAGLRLMIDNEKNSEVRSALTLFLNTIVGKPAYDISSVADKNINALKGASYGILLGSVLSMGFEGIKATASILSNSNSFRTGLREMRNIFSEIPKNSNLIDELMYSFNGVGGQSIRRETQFKGIDSMFNVQEDISGVVNSVANANKAATLFLSRMVQTDDAFKRIASEDNIYRLYDLANGKGSMSKARMARYGIDDELLNIVRNRIKKTNGEITTLGLDKWTPQEATRLRATLHQMNQSRSSEVTIGGIPKFFVDNSAGRLLSFVGSFTAMMYNVHFLGGLRSMDAEEAASQIAWLVGGMASTLAKDAIFGDPDNPISDEELVKRTLMSSPALSAFAIVNLFSNPVAPAQADYAMTTLGNIATLGIEE